MRNNEEIGKLAVQHGAQDYLLKARLDSYLLPKTVGSMIERAANAEALFEEKERAEVTLNSIGDAVMSTDVWGKCDVSECRCRSADGLVMRGGKESSARGSVPDNRC